MKDKLLDVAIDHFGRMGFEGAATRAIASEADTAMSSITYHFGGKEGLYLACADRIAAQVRDRLGPLLEEVGAVQDGDREAARNGLLVLLGGFARVMLDPASERWARFVAREQQAPSEAFERLYRNVMKPVSDTVIALITVARPDLNAQEVRATAVTLWGQAIALRAARASASRIMQVPDLKAAASALLIERVLENARCILSSKPENAG
ncbi:CerR family C-terminal domain-containing protein [Pelagerythrobacter marensis]|uniref:CerR family C-terminal domain-containing protein n=1 Tax=Pelagerythrobacter marensis TaxID=543877 RepID=A0ABZ2D6J4_9SPHN